jgi:anthranilate phosphoribosyltransferase
MTDLLTRSLDALAAGHDLTADEAAAVLSEIMGGNATEIQIAGLLIALRTKGETVEELAGLARSRTTTCSTPPAPEEGGERSTSPPPPR